MKKVKIISYILTLIIGILLTIMIINISNGTLFRKAKRISINVGTTYHLYYNLKDSGIKSDKLYDQKGDTYYFTKARVNSNGDLIVTFVDVEWEKISNNGVIQYHPVISKPYVEFYSNMQFVVMY